jgi:ribosomal protein L11 methyltransferase
VSWTALRITPNGNRDGVIAALFASGSQGVLEDGASLVTHFPPDAQLDDIRNEVLTADPQATVVITSTPDADYSQWRASVSAHRIGGLTIAPPWLAAELDPATTVAIDPAMAFGTGEHPTTRSVVLLMQSVIRPGDVVADLGSGSAVLSIAAAKLGAARVAAIELDHDAIENAEENVRSNGVADRVEVLEGDASTLLPLLAPVRVVLANIISSVLLELLPTMRSSLAPDGQAIMSGILSAERSTIVAALQAGRWRIEAETTEDAWWTVQIAPQ